MLFSQNRKLSDELFASLKENFLCNDEGEECGHLGVKINTEDGTITLKYPQLIKITIELLALKTLNPKSTLIANPSFSVSIDEKDIHSDSFHHSSIQIFFNT